MSQKDMSIDAASRLGAIASIELLSCCVFELLLSDNLLFEFFFDSIPV